MFFSTQCCGMAIDIVILILTLVEQNVWIHSRKMFVSIILESIMCLYLDMASVFGIMYADKLPIYVTEFFCKAYLSSLVAAAFCGCLYVNAEYGKYNQEKQCGKFIAPTLWLLFFVGIALPFLFPISYHYDNKTLYTYGAACIVTYLFCFAFILYTLFCAIFLLKNGSWHRRMVIIIWQLLWLAAAVIQYYFPQILIVGFATAVGNLLLFAQLENPADDFSKEFGCYNLSIMMQWMNERIKKGERFSAAAFFIDIENMRNDVVALRDVVIYIVKYLNKITESPVFSVTRNGLVVAFRDEAQMKYACRMTRAYFENEIKIPKINEPVDIGIRILSLPDSTIMQSVDDIMRYVAYFREKVGIGNYIEINQSTVSEFYHYYEMVDIIRSAVREHRVETFYQPIYDAREKAFCSAEALVRIRNRDGSIIPPGEFIGVAEDSGLISELGLVVFESVCKLLSGGWLKNTSIKYIHYNLSVVQLEDENLERKLLKFINKYGISTSKINLEITESAKIHFNDQLKKNIDKLVNLGFAFSLDDFGTGRSNLNYLISLPVTMVKFDKTITQDYFTQVKSHYYMKCIMDMLRNAGVEVVVEGIETKDQLQEMVSLCVDFIQGYCFSRPLPEKDFVDFLIEKNQEKIL